MDVQEGVPLSRDRGCDAEDSFLLLIFLVVADTRPREVTTIPITSSKAWDTMARQKEDCTPRHLPPMVQCCRKSDGLPVIVANNALADIKPSPQWEP
ncbi:hypothetical protein LX36DRAFT_710979 [Colletotrichum falcatum]|nr:hypothetical protein LX36DRAFT_710979 [Colletotrichum falcatum]